MQEKVMVLGLGVSGKASALFLLNKGYQVIGVDTKIVDTDPKIEKIASSGAALYTEEVFPPVLMEECSFIVTSPGIADLHPLLRMAHAKKKSVISEIELGLKHTQQRCLAITGTNGKTTVTLLTEHVLKQTGRKAKAVGNVGFALTQYLLDPDPEDILVMELSSYQLETLRGPFFSAATILNITPDHLDRYDSFASYARAKINIELCLQEEGELFISPSVAKEYGCIFCRPYDLIPEDPNPEKMAKHDVSNLQASFALCHSVGVSKQEFMQAAISFTKPAHRIEFVKTIGGVSYFDDSKGTNVDATIQAVQSMQGPVILIVGGVDKGFSYLIWKEVFEKKVKHILALGQAAEKISQELSLFFNVKIVDSLGSAVQEAAKLAVEGDAVLLSPGCASFDMFRDYAHRGKEFQRFVGLLEEGDFKL